MGDTRGFLKYGREGTRYRPVEERLKDWKIVQQDFPPEKMAAVCGIDAETIEKLLEKLLSHPLVGEALGDGVEERPRLEPDEVDRLVVAYERILVDLRRARQELQADARIDFRNARKICLRKLEMDYDDVFRHEQQVIDARHQVERLARRYLAMSLDVGRLSEDPPAEGVARLYAPVRDKMNEIEQLELTPAGRAAVTNCRVIRKRYSFPRL